MSARDLMLEEVLESALRGVGLGPVAVLDRHPHSYASTHSAEVVTFRCQDGSVERVHLKYGDAQTHAAAHGHRGPLEAEGRAYRELVMPTGLSAPRLYGTHLDDNGCTWLLIEHLGDAVELDEAPDPKAALTLAATWIGAFQRWHEDAGTIPSSPVYDHRYYAGWLKRTMDYGHPWSARLPWLRDLADVCDPLLQELAAVPTSVIHGEFTPSNVLFRGGHVYPVDWQSTALALGEIDVIGLLDKWPPSIAVSAAGAYVAARREQDLPGQARLFDLARLYWDLRWLGDRPEWTALEKVGPRFHHLHAVVERLDGWRT